MKRFLFALIAVALCSATASAQRLQVGVRGGVNLADQSFRRISVGDNVVSQGSAKVGYEAGVALRINISKHLHLQSEFNYNFVNYAYNVAGKFRTNVALRTERFEIPVQLGFQFGHVRLFGGASFRIAQSQHSSAPTLLKVGFNDDDIALMGGIGINVRKFFLDLRMSGYPQSHVWQTLTSNGDTQRVKVGRSIVYGASMGFFF